MAEPNDPEQSPETGPFFRQWREKAALSQERLAAKMRVSNATISKHEAGQRKGVSFAYLQKFAAATGCSPWDPLMWPPGILPQTCAVLLELSPQDQLLVCQIAELLRDRAASQKET